MISFNSPVDHNAGPLPSLGVHFERVLDVVVRVAVVPHHVRLQLVLRERDIKQQNFDPPYFFPENALTDPIALEGDRGPSRKSLFLFKIQQSNIER